MTPDVAMHYFGHITASDAPCRQQKGRVKHPGYGLILSTTRRKSVPEIEKMR
jgi:hypothetical protein